MLKTRSGGFGPKRAFFNEDIKFSRTLFHCSKKPSLAYTTHKTYVQKVLKFTLIFVLPTLVALAVFTLIFMPEIRRHTLSKLMPHKAEQLWSYWNSSNLYLSLLLLVTLCL